ncbi:MAG: LapA family protein [Acidobacteriota bacterium]
MNILIYVVVCLFFIILLVVGIYNNAEVTLNLVLWRNVGPLPLGGAIAAAALFGVAFTCTIGLLDGIKIRITNRQLRRQISRLEEEADSLRLSLARHETQAAGAEPSAEEASPEPPGSPPPVG